MIKNYNTKYGKCNITYLEYQKVVEKLNHLLSIHFNLLPPHSLFDACPSARKTFVYARMLTIEYNPHWREKSAFCLFMCRYVLRSIDTFIRSTTTTIITNTKRRILLLRVFIILSSRHIHSYRIFNQYIKDSDKVAFIFV